MICSLYLATAFCLNIITCPIYDKTATFTAYTLSKEETDSSPTIGAWGDELSKASSCVVASRNLPKDTILDIRGYGRCRVLDRTSKKYSDRIDILLPTKKEAIKFGKKELEYRIIP